MSLLNYNEQDLMWNSSVRNFW